jgi:23S rRNA pseudouridine1911/1915/1917 synthase
VVTHYETVETYAHASVVEFEFEMGCTHQIRVHARSLRG